MNTKLSSCDVCSTANVHVTECDTFASTYLCVHCAASRSTEGVVHFYYYLNDRLCSECRSKGAASYAVFCYMCVSCKDKLYRVKINGVAMYLSDNLPEKYQTRAIFSKQVVDLLKMDYSWIKKTIVDDNIELTITE
jgi:hypothetical protein